MASGVLVEHSSGAAGRGLFTTTTIEEGQLLIRSKPYVAVEAVELLRCSRCKFARYCSQECQRIAWTEHREECSDILRLAPRHPTDTVMLTARLLRKRKADTAGYSEVTHLNTYREHYGKESLETFFQLATLVLYFVGEPYRTSIDEIVDILCKTNNFSISDSEMRTVGAGLYPFASLVNHSCCPTAVAIFTGREVSIRAIQRLAPDSEVTLSYIEVATPTEIRRRELKSTWFFECACKLCTMTTPAAVQRDRLLTAAHIPCLHGSSNPASCVECGAIRTRVATMMAEEQKRDKNNLKALKEALQLAQQLGPVTSWLSLVAAQALQTGAIESADWTAATNACSQVLQVFEAVYMRNWPLTGLQHAMLAKLQKLLGACKESEQHFRAALSILRITHGPEHPLLATLRQLLDEVMTELAFNTKALT